MGNPRMALARRAKPDRFEYAGSVNSVGESQESVVTIMERHRMSMGNEAEWTEAVVAERIVEIVRAKSEQPVTLQSTFDELGIDSLAMAEVIFEIELAFKIRADDHLLDLRNLREVIDYVNRTLKKKGR